MRTKKIAYVALALLAGAAFVGCQRPGPFICADPDKVLKEFSLRLEKEIASCDALIQHIDTYGVEPNTEEGKKRTRQYYVSQWGAYDSMRKSLASFDAVASNRVAVIENLVKKIDQEARERAIGDRYPFREMGGFLRELVDASNSGALITAPSPSPTRGAS